jgi:hypothetical protein
LKTVQSDFTSKGLYRIDALAASTDFLLTQVDRMLSRVEPSPIMNLGLLGESPLLLNTGSSGRLVATFETLQGECPAFCVSVIWSMLPERSKDNDDFKRTAGRVAEGLQAT